MGGYCRDEALLHLLSTTLPMIVSTSRYTRASRYTLPMIVSTCSSSYLLIVSTCIYLLYLLDCIYLLIVLSLIVSTLVSTLIVLSLIVSTMIVSTCSSSYLCTSSYLPSCPPRAHTHPHPHVRAHERRHIGGAGRRGGHDVKGCDVDDGTPQ